MCSADLQQLGVLSFLWTDNRMPVVQFDSQAANLR
jgi:hypothetical protein